MGSVKTTESKDERNGKKPVMRLIEQFTEGKHGNPELCEDLYVLTENFAAVVDGATNVSGKLFHHKTPGRIAAETIKTSIEELEPDADVKQMIKTINANMQKVHEAYDLTEEIERYRWKAPSASLVVYSRHRQEIWQIGDCQFMMDGVLHQNEKDIDHITANARSMYLEAELKKGKTINDLKERDTGWEYIQPLIQQQYYLQNDLTNQYGFEVVNGFLVDASDIKVIKVPEETKHLVFASDGYPYLKDTLVESEAMLKEVLEEDPLCFRKFKSAKGLMNGNRSYDDRLYMKIILE
ncbi:hypothetical protein [Sediminibacillus terrae]|uniref:hypothetical protein n=1 Tax=Sediminibacillus terrae TaxID=1562106 RepID=UPI0012962771|nr:hypothetical protein [Sediminibacillus terrae]